MREILSAALAILVFASPFPSAAQPPAKPPSPAAQANVLAVTPDDRVLGKSDAPVTIIEYASLTCPHCAHFATEVLPKLKTKWIDTGKARLVMRDYPLDEPALRAAMIARCAPADKFYPLVDTFFGSQRQWVLSKDYKTDLARLALLGGINKTQFDACLGNKSVEDKVLQSRLSATQDLGVNSTPTFFINGVKFEGAPEEDALDAALSKAAGA
ncbi:MAG TPA: DsbA family protein [Stellaceae bacterium]|nr:DsbA family protein [Stellaceae bacterium]